MVLYYGQKVNASPIFTNSPNLLSKLQVWHRMKRTATEIEEKIELKTQKTIRCRSCGHIVTSPELAREPHEHHFRNPLGILFHVLCFSDAPGALDVGVPTTEFCWFPGYAWSYAACQQCQEHLGWWYHGPDRFAGLIATRLDRESEG